MKLLHWTSIALLCFVCWTCDTALVEPTSTFSKIYDNSEFDQLKAISIQQTADGGYIVLGTLGNSGLVSNVYYDAPFLMRLSPTGEVLWTTRQNSAFRNYINPVPQLIVNENEYLFWCLEANDWGDYDMALVRVSDSNRDPITVFSKPDAAQIWYALQTEDKSIVLVGVSAKSTETRFDVNTEVYKLDNNYNLIWEKSFAQGESTGSTRLDELIPEYFFCTEGFYQNTQVYIINTIDAKGDQVIFKMLDINNGEIFSESKEADVFPIALAQWQEDKFVGAFTNLRDVDLNANYEWNPTEEKPYELNRIFHELALGHRIVLKNEKIKNKDIRFFGATTKNYAILLYTWGEVGTEFQVLGRLYLGDTNVYTFADLVRTQDGGAVILGSTIIADRFSRICLFKLSKKQVDDLVPN